MIPWYLWLLVALGAFVAEALTLSLVMGSVALAALLAAAFSSVVTWPVQIGVFAGATLILLFAVRPVALRLVPGRTGAAEVPRIGPLGDRGVAIERIDARSGQVRIGQGDFWSARTQEPDIVIQPGREVEIIRTEGLEVVVRPVTPVRSLAHVRPEGDAQPWGLSARELEVLALVTEGMSNGEIAERLILSPRTVHHHVSHILAKMNASSRVDAVRLAMDEGIIVPKRRPR